MAMPKEEPSTKVVNCNILGNTSSLWPAIDDNPPDKTGLKRIQQNPFNNINCIQLRDERANNPALSPINWITLTSENQNDIIQPTSYCEPEIDNEVHNLCLNPIVPSIVKSMSFKLSSILLKNSEFVPDQSAYNEAVDTNHSNSKSKACLPANIAQNKTKRNCFKTTNKSSKGTSSTIVSSRVNEPERNIIPDSESFCSTCQVECGSVELLQEHKKNKPFICRVCTESFENHLHLETHFFTHTIFKCKQCSKVFHYKRDLSQHQKSSIKCHSKIECEICHKMISANGSKLLKRHILLKHSNAAEVYKCIVCDKRFSQSHLLLKHNNFVHTAFENIECNTCKKIFIGPERLRKHIKKFHLDVYCEYVQCSVCNKIVRMSSLKSHMLKVHDDKVRMCKNCGKSIKGFSAMKLHMQKEHSRIGTIICNLCNEKFDGDLSLLMHKRKVHHKRSASKAAFCEICGKQYKTLRILKMHKAIHFNEKPFKCEICGAAFKQNVTLKLHGRVHSSIGKYICESCGDNFKWKQTFDKHVKNCVSSNTENNISDG